MQKTTGVYEIPIQEKYMLSIKETGSYFNIGIKKMRRLAELNEGMTTKMKEKLELYLISQPEVQCINNYLGEIHQRGGIDHE